MDRIGVRLLYTVFGDSLKSIHIFPGGRIAKKIVRLNIFRSHVCSTMSLRGASWQEEEASDSIACVEYFDVSTRQRQIGTS